MSLAAVILPRYKPCQQHHYDKHPYYIIKFTISLVQAWNLTPQNLHIGTECLALLGLLLPGGPNFSTSSTYSYISLLYQFAILKSLISRGLAPKLASETAYRLDICFRIWMLFIYRTFLFRLYQCQSLLWCCLWSSLSLNPTWHVRHVYEDEVMAISVEICYKLNKRGLWIAGHY